MLQQEILSCCGACNECLDISYAAFIRVLHILSKLIVYQSMCDAINKFGVLRSKNLKKNSSRKDLKLVLCSKVH